jgi:HSP20 family protein
MGGAKAPGGWSMSITRDSLKDLVSLQQRMNRLFEQTLSSGGDSQEDLRGGGWAPAVDIEETQDRIVLRADLPGVSEGHFEIRIENQHLTLRGEREFPSGTRREDFHRVERSFGSFFRSFTLPQSVDQDAVRAELKNGVLEVTLPKKSEAKSKPIQVQVR